MSNEADNTYYSALNNLLKLSTGGGVSISDWTTEHSLITSNGTLYTSLLKTNPTNNVALNALDPIRSNVFAYWYLNSDGKLSFRSKELNEAKLTPQNYCKLFKGVKKCPDDLLSEKYYNIGFKIAFAPPNSERQGFMKNPTGMAPFDIVHRQTLIFTFDYDKFRSVYDAYFTGDLAVNLNKKTTMHSLLGTSINEDLSNTIYFYSILASFLANPAEKFENNPLANTRWTTPSHTAEDDSQYKGFFNYNSHVWQNHELDNTGPFQKPAGSFVYYAAYFGHKIHNRYFRDMTFNAPLPQSEEVSVLNNLVPKFQGQYGSGGGYIDIKPVYNFYIPLYENGIRQQANLKEHLLPNLYAFYDYENNKTSAGQSIKDNLTLQGSISENVLQGVIGINEEPIQGVDNSNQYFDLFGKLAFDQNIDDITINKAKEKFSHIFFSPENLKFIEEANESKSAFPMYVDIKLDTETPGEFCKLFSDTNNMMDLMRAYVATWFTWSGVSNKEKGFLNWNDDLNGTLTPYINDKSPYDNTAGQSSMLTDWKRFARYNFCTTWETPPGIPQTQVGAALNMAYNMMPGLNSQTISHEHDMPSFDIFRWWHSKMQDDLAWFHGEQYTPSVVMSKLFNKFGLNFGSWEESIVSDPYTDFANQIKELLYVANLKNLIKKHFRTYDEIMMGHKAYSEVLFYRIEKTGFLDGIGGQKIRLQNFWIPNMPGHDVTNYIDTQVKYGNRYQYRIFAYKIVIGNTYAYKFYDTSTGQDLAKWVDKPLKTAPGSPLRYDMPPAEGIINYTTVVNSAIEAAVSDTAGTTAPNANAHFVVGEDELGIQHAYMDIHNQPNVQLLEVPIYETEVTMVDHPPMAPDVDINSYIGVPDKIKIDLNSQSGDRDLKPIPINEGDMQKFDLIRYAQKRSLKNLDGTWLDPTIRFKFDDMPSAFQFFRIDFKPSKYSDFSDGLVAEVRTDIGSAHIDSIVPNKKYYYTFRTIDVHNQVSNPSMIYEVEMVSEGEVSFLTYNVLDLDEEKKKERPITNTKSARQYMRIFPSDIQLLVNESLSPQNSGAESALELGLGGSRNVFGQELEESVFNNKVFKIRLTSKTTGRKIDLNLKFIVEHMPADKKLLNKT